LKEAKMAFSSTFSIVACDVDAGELGVAVQSKFLAVGAAVPWAKARIGAVATQSYANTSFGPEGLRLLKDGLAPQEALDRLLDGDSDRELRQVGIVDGRGRSASFTGVRCLPWAGHLTGPGLACQGNILASGETVAAMAEAFGKTRGPLAVRLLTALDAGQRAGGDRRGKQSAALLVVKERGGYGGFDDRYIDLRVDDHPEPITELARLYDLHRLYFAPPGPDDLVPLDKKIIASIQRSLSRLNYYGGPNDGRWSAELERALFDFCGTENLEEHLRSDDRFDRRILEHIEELLTKRG
jgi:uncharacterized Ntn-hydrolase superfamily protein